VRRWALGTIVAFAGIGVLAAAMVPLRSHLSVATPALVLVVPVVAGVAVGGLASGVLAVAAGFITYDALFIPPYGTLTVGAAQNWAALAVYAVVMLIVARIFAFLRRARLEARHDAAATRRLYELSNLLIGDQPVTRVLQVIAHTLHQAFDAHWVAVLIPSEDDDGRLTVAATAGAPPPEDLATLAPVGGKPETLQPGADAPRRADRIVRTALVARGRPVGMVAMAGAALHGHEAQVVRTYANQAALALEASQLREQALRAELLEQVDELRGALMGAVSHDLRTPLASIKTAVSALRRGDEQSALDERDRQELLALIEERSDALDRLVANLLDMTRIQAGALELRRAITPVSDVVEGGIRASAVPPESVTVDLPNDLPPVDVDTILMEQVLANLLDNAARHSPDGAAVCVGARVHQDVVELAVSDKGPGVPPEERDHVFTMFSRLGAQGRAGLGLAIAKAFVEAHGQTIRVEDSPGGGARFVLSLPASQVPAEV
jgi:two-component system sensor histidine kinase KdpD